jgi:hypothetical protein
LIRLLLRQFSFWGALAALIVLAGCTGAAQLPPAAPPPAPPAEAAPVGWTPLGGPPGPVTALVADDQTPPTLYAATRPGVYRSTDQGGSWQALPGAGAPAGPVTALLALPGDESAPAPAGVLVGTARGFWRWQPDGWSRVVLPDGTGVMVLAGTPASVTPVRLYAGTTQGLYVSLDKGATWQAGGADRAIVRGLAVAPDGGAFTLSTNTGLRRRDATGSWTAPALPVLPGGIAPQVWALASTGQGLLIATETGVYLQTGDAWLRLTRSPARALAPLPDGTWIVGGDGGALTARLTDDDAANMQRGGPPQRTGLPSAPIYALVATPGGIFAATEGGVYVSADGVRWRDRSAGLPATGTIQGLAVLDGDGASALFAGSSAGVFRSEDGGGTWRLAATGLPPGGVRDLARSAGTGPVLFAATARGVYTSTDGAGSWQPAAGQPPNPDIQRLWTDPNDPARLYAALGGAGGLAFSWNGGKGWVNPAVGLPSGAEVTALLIDPSDPARPYAGVRYGQRGGLLADAGVPAVWRAEASSGPEGGEMRWQPVGTGLRLAAPGDAVTALARAPGDGRLLAATTAGVWAATTDGAAVRWSKAADWPATSAAATGGALAIYPQRPEILFAAGNGTIAHWTGDAARWQPLGRPPQAARLDALAVVPITGTAGISDSAQVLAALAGRGLWQYTDTGLPAVAMAEATPRPPLPTDPVPPADNAYFRYFPETGHNVGGGFRAYWEANDGLRYFGYPLTEEFQDFNFADNITRTVQYFERVRLEVHPEANGGPGTISIGSLGRDLTIGRFFSTARFFVSDARHIYFAETQHSISGAFYPFWRDHGALARFGFPISEELHENGYTVQYFERARLEYHPEFSGTPQEIQLGALGLEAMQRRGWK